MAQADFSEIGTTRARAQTLKDLALAVQSKKISMHSEQDPQKFRADISQIKGIGPWSSEYISLKALGDTDAFPGSDLILKRVTDRHPEIQLDKIRPWRSYAAIYFWKEFSEKYSKKAPKKCL